MRLYDDRQNSLKDERKKEHEFHPTHHINVTKEGLIIIGIVSGCFILMLLILSCILCSQNEECESNKNSSPKSSKRHISRPTINSDDDGFLSSSDESEAKETILWGR